MKIRHQTQNVGDVRMEPSSGVILCHDTSVCEYFLKLVTLAQYESRFQKRHSGKNFFHWKWCNGFMTSQVRPQIRQEKFILKPYVFGTIGKIFSRRVKVSLGPAFENQLLGSY